MDNLIDNYLDEIQTPADLNNEGEKAGLENARAEALSRIKDCGRGSRGRHGPCRHGALGCRREGPQRQRRRQRQPLLAKN